MLAKRVAAGFGLCRGYSPLRLQPTARPSKGIRCEIFVPTCQPFFQRPTLVTSPASPTCYIPIKNRYPFSMTFTFILILQTVFSFTPCPSQLMHE